MPVSHDSRFHALQPEVRWHDRAANYALLQTMIDRAAPHAGDFVLLPEMCDTGWTTDRAALLGGETLSWMIETARARNIWLQAGFAHQLENGRFTNAAAIVNPRGEVKAIYHKHFLFPGEREGANAFVAGNTLHIVDCGFAKICPLVCYDLRFPELWRIAAHAGAEVFTIGASWPSQRQEPWRQLLVARAMENQACVVASNRTGSDPSHRYVGGAAIVSPLGVRVAEGSETDSHVSATFDRAEIDRVRAEFSALRDLDRALLGHCEVVHTR
ncbi:MAG: hypothetical protein EXS10_08915 [Phycisphaerales bacterium]|nr:hypothetical protein [Phycisphaerales bacterium]